MARVGVWIIVGDRKTSNDDCAGCEWRRPEWDPDRSSGRHSRRTQRLTASTIARSVRVLRVALGHYLAPYFVLYWPVTKTALHRREAFQAPKVPKIPLPVSLSQRLTIPSAVGGLHCDLGYGNSQLRAGMRAGGRECTHCGRG